MSHKFVVLAGLLNVACMAVPVHSQAVMTGDTARHVCAGGAEAHSAMDHAAHMAALSDCDAPQPAMPGQAAFGTIAEVVRLLRADSTTDWSRVNIEALRQHLIDMDDVVLHAAAAQRRVPGGLDIDVSGTGRTVGAIQRMVANHARMLDQLPEYHAVTSPTPTGVRLRVTARDPSDARRVAEIRALGFAGILTEGEHHAAHHLALARGDDEPHGR